MPARNAGAVAEIRSLATPLEQPADLDPLVERIGDARLVLLGEASHGTAEYYRWRAVLTRRLIEEAGFAFVAVEGDWPDCAAVNCWVKGRSGGTSARDVLGRFDRWPTWMWANEEVARFAGWLHDHNRATGAGVGFYGLDVYSLWDSLRAVLGYLEEHRPDALAAAHEALRCFEPYGEDPQRYARATRLVPDTCEAEVLDLLLEVRGAGHDVVDLDDDEAWLDAEQNAEVLAGAERYYRTMVRGDGESWNVRDCHMVDTLDRLLRHHGPGAKAVVWEHNTHVGDARATDMVRHGMINVGQVVRERHERDGVVIVGFGGHHGTVLAGRSWGAPAERMVVPPAPAGTHEDLLHRAVGRPSLLVFGDDRSTPWLGVTRDHRAIGVVYRPEQDPWGNWVPTTMGRRYDAFLSFDDTTALSPLQAAGAAVGVERDTEPWGT
jgi:erythromycin esterase-like protein